MTPFRIPLYDFPDLVLHADELAVKKQLDVQIEARAGNRERCARRASCGSSPPAAESSPSAPVRPPFTPVREEFSGIDDGT